MNHLPSGAALDLAIDFARERRHRSLDTRIVG
jgi:hypothetical protein